jgi:hypothetical protein
VKAMKFLLLSLSFFMLLSSQVGAQPTEVVASVDKNPVMADESFNLTITANDDVDRSAFDPSVLMKDFVVGRTSVSTQTQMINFNTTRTTIWTTVLIPRKQGRFTIPAFNVDGQTTQAIPIMVVPVSASTSVQGRDIFITTELDVPEAYLQQQLRYTVKLYLGQDLQRGSLANPSLENADIRQIGKDKEYNEIKDGRRYRVIERTFAIIPQQSGNFTIDGPLFEGEIIDNSRQSFGFFNRSTPVNRVGPSQDIMVLPIPPNYPHHWLPSDYVQINEEWQGDPEQYHAGEPITRTITLTAIGVVEEQLPTINGTYPDNVKTYPDQAETATVEKDQTLIAQRKESVAIIPSEPGQLVLPEISVPWFNVLTKKTEYTSLPAKTLNILPSVNQSASPIPLVKPEVSTEVVTNTKPGNPQTSTIMISEPDRTWQLVSAVLLAIWLVTLALWIWQAKFRSKKVFSHAQQVKQPEHSMNAQWSSLDKALSQADKKSVAILLPHFLANILGQSHLTLSQSLQKLGDQQLINEVNLMLAAQYGQATADWNGEALKQALRPYLKGASAKSDTSKQALKPLYPSA